MQALDSEESATPITTEDHLSYPTLSDEDIPEASTSKIQQPRQTLQDRLYVGNLHPGVLSPANLFEVREVTKFDFLFHKTGLLKGKPRGYAFVEYGNKDDALKAMSAVHDKLLRDRKLVVTFAQQAPIDPGLGPSSLKRRVMTESGRPTTLSMIKSGMGNRHEGMEDKIAMMEAKLRQMERSKSNPNDHGSLPYHASLPPKPLPEPAPALPSLPLIPQPAFELHNSKGLSGTSRPANSASRENAAFVGVKLKKAKEKDEAVSRPTDDAR
ncbi:RNA-binding domain-containing protein [Mycena pura]|uniref:RNA-binding domain-containing protein n=1 Tax=Mycena pura TaxID=153505 RepID=A0AAD6V8Y4_9AGAR|nr:RNA-binding domain-containing protein [Mycena pura]